jgi:dTDP-4-dehydrorhamnose 3,5-epimerase-like enzyme
VKRGKRKGGTGEEEKRGNGKREKDESMNKVVIEKLPATKQRTGAKRWTEERGEFVQISYKEEMRHLAVFEIREGFSRGTHFHEKKEEVFYIFTGKIKATFVDMDTLQGQEQVLEKGDRIRIQPRCGHIFYALQDTVVVEYSPQVYDPEDSYKLDFEGLVHSV